MKRRAAVLSGALLLLAAASLRAQVDDATKQLAHDIFKQLVEINTTDSVGSTTVAAEAMAARLRDAGFPAGEVQVLGPNARKGNLVVRLHGTGARKPLLMICHLDVVEAKREDWSTDPFQFIEKDGYFYGRGTEDVKDGDAILVTMMIRFQIEGYRPDRDIILALTADEEGGTSNGVDWLLRNHRELIDAEYILNPDAGSFEMQNGKRLLIGVQASEKLYADFQLEVKNKGGHSSEPRPDNAIYSLTDGLAKIARYQFPLEINDVTRAYFSRMADLVGGQTGADMKAILRTPPDPAAVARLSESAYYNGHLRTTCVATRLEAGHANNALPQNARANVNCRIFPGHPPEEIRQTLIQILGDAQISVTRVETATSHLKPSPSSTLSPFVMGAIEKVSTAMWPGVPVVPSMDAGASDGAISRAAGIPTYGIAGVWTDIDDDRAHGRDERVGVDAFYEGVDFYYRLVKTLSSRN